MKNLIMIVIGALMLFVGCPTQHLNLSYPNYALPLDVVLETTTDTQQAKVTATANATEYSKYTFTIINLAADMGKQFVVAGASISSTTSNLGDNWNVEADKITDKGLVGTIDETGTLSITFYGTKPGWASKDSAMFKICQYGTWSNPYFQTGGDNGYIGGSNTGTPSGNYDVEVTVDASKF